MFVIQYCKFLVLYVYCKTQYFNPICLIHSCRTSICTILLYPCRHLWLTIAKVRSYHGAIYVLYVLSAMYYVLNSINFILCTLCTIYYVLNTINCILYILRTICTIYYVLNTINYILYILCTICTMHCVLNSKNYIPEYTLYNTYYVLCTKY